MALNANIQLSSGQVVSVTGQGPTLPDGTYVYIDLSAQSNGQMLGYVYAPVIWNSAVNGGAGGYVADPVRMPDYLEVLDQTSPFTGAHTSPSQAGDFYADLKIIEEGQGSVYTFDNAAALSAAGLATSLTPGSYYFTMGDSGPVVRAITQTDGVDNIANNTDDGWSISTVPETIDAADLPAVMALTLGVGQATPVEYGYYQNAFDIPDGTIKTLNADGSETGSYLTFAQGPYEFYQSSMDNWVTVQNYAQPVATDADGDIYEIGSPILIEPFDTFYSSFTVNATNLYQPEDYSYTSGSGQPVFMLTNGDYTTEIPTGNYVLVIENNAVTAVDPVQGDSANGFTNTSTADRISITDSADKAALLALDTNGTSVGFLPVNQVDNNTNNTNNNTNTGEFSIALKGDGSGLLLDGYDSVNDPEWKIKLIYDGSTYEANISGSTDSFVTADWTQFTGGTPLQSSTPVAGSVYVIVHQDDNMDYTPDPGELYATSQINFTGNTFGSGGNVVPWSAPTVVVEGDLSPGSDAYIKWSDGSSVTAATVRLEDADGTNVRSLTVEPGTGRVAIPVDAQGLTLEVEYTDPITGMTRVVEFGDVPNSPLVAAFTLGSAVDGALYTHAFDLSEDQDAPFAWDRSHGLVGADATDVPVAKIDLLWMPSDTLKPLDGTDPAADPSNVVAKFHISAGGQTIEFDAEYSAAGGTYYYSDGGFHDYGAGWVIADSYGYHDLFIDLPLQGDGGEVAVSITFMAEGYEPSDPRSGVVVYDHTNPRGWISDQHNLPVDNDNGGAIVAEWGGFPAGADAILNAAGSIFNVGFTEPVYFSRIYGGNNPSTTSVETLARSFLSDPKGGGSENTVTQMYFHVVDVMYDGAATATTGWVTKEGLHATSLFDQVIVVSSDADAQLTLDRPMNVQDVVVPGEQTDTALDWAVQDDVDASLTDGEMVGTFTISGYASPMVKGLEGDVQFAAIEHLFAEDGTYGAFEITWGNVTQNALTYEFSAELSIKATVNQYDPTTSTPIQVAITPEYMAVIESALTADVIRANIVETFSAGLSDAAGNILDGMHRDAPVVIDGNSLTDVFYEPATGTGGIRDWLDVTALGSGTYVDSEYGEVYSLSGSQYSQYLIADFGTIAFSGSNNWLEGGSASSHSYRVNGLGSGNTIAGGRPVTDWVTYSDADDVGGVTVDFSAAPVVVVLDNQTDTRDWTEVIRDSGTDYITGIDNFVGSAGDDTITGSAGFQVLAGSAGDDTITGNGSAGAATAGDLLVGWRDDDDAADSKTDTLIGSSGVTDILVDIDGAVMQGRADADAWSVGDKEQVSDHDLFIVRDNATIKNFALSSDETHLSGRSGFAADRITFALDTSAVIIAAMAIYHPSVAVDPDGADFALTPQIEEAVKKFVQDKLSVSKTVDGNDLLLALTDGTNTWGDVRLVGIAGTLGAEAEAQVVRLDKYEASRFDAVEYAAQELSAAAYTGAQAQAGVAAVVTSFLETLVLNGSEIHIPIALESVVAGTIGDTSPGKVMSAPTGILDIVDREFVPGYGDQDILGGRGSDTYKFVLQDFTEESGGIAGDAGRDRVIDAGGNDDLYLKNATIDDLHIEAIRVGREVNANTIRVNYEQSDGNGLTNQGTVDWLGAFRDGGRTALETITVRDAEGNDVTYHIAQADYDQPSWSVDFYGETHAFNSESGRTFVVDTDIASHWIVVGTTGETDIIKVTGDTAMSPDYAGDIRFFGFDHDLDVIDASEYFAANAAENFSITDFTLPASRNDWDNWFNANIDDNVVKDDAAKAVQVFTDVTDAAPTPEVLATLYFMDYQGTLDDLPIYFFQ